MIRFFILFSFILFLPYFSFVSYSNGTEIFEWGKKSPLEFIALLKQTTNAPWCFTVNESLPPCKDGTFSDCSFKTCQYTTIDSHKNWVSVQDIPALIRLLDSQTSCASVALAISSFISIGTSTVGHEAAFLIEGFRRGQYPPELNSSRWEADKKEILAWWNKYKIENLTTK